MVSGISGILTIISSMGVNLHIPRVLWLIVLVLGLLIAQFLAFHELRSTRSNSERESVRQSRIQLAVKQLGGLCDTLQAMHHEAQEYVSGVALKDVTDELVDEVQPYLFIEYPALYAEKESWSNTDQLKYFLDLAALMDTLGIGLEEMFLTRSWMKLEQQLKAFQIGDMVLLDLVKEFKIILVGAQSNRLYHRYEEARAVPPKSHQQLRANVRGRTSGQAMEVFIQRALTKVVERVNKSLCGV